MAIFNATLISGTGPTGVYKAFCETKEDLVAPAAKPWAPGSAVVCMNTDTDEKPTGHVKLPDGSWTGTNEEAEANDG